MASELKPELLNSVPEAPKKSNNDQTKTDAHINGNANQTKVLNILLRFILYSHIIFKFIIIVGRTNI